MTAEATTLAAELTRVEPSPTGIEELFEDHSALVIACIRLEYARGGSLGEIARALAADGVPTAHGGRQWWPSTVRAVLLRETR